MNRIAVLQMTSGIDPGANAQVLTGAIGAAEMGGATMVFTPEMSGLLDRERARAAQHRGAPSSSAPPASHDGSVG